MKRKYLDLCDQRTNLLEQARNYLSADNKAEYDSTMEKVTNINEDIDRVKKLLDPFLLFRFENSLLNNLSILACSHCCNDRQQRH